MDNLKITVNNSLDLKLLQIKDAQALFSLTDKNRANLRVWLGWVDKTNKIAEIGYWLDKDFQGKGIMVNTVKFLINYGFKKLKLEKLIISVVRENLKSLTIQKKLGFTHEKTLKNTPCPNCNFLDHEIYSIQKKDWAKLPLE